MMRILFIDDEKNVLEGLRRAMHSMRGEWTMTFLTSGAEALEFLKHTPVDVVVSDMRMPGMGGHELLAQVKQLYPQVVRFILSGYAQPAAIMQVVASAHQFLSKPCDGNALKTAIARTLTLRHLLRDERFAERIGRVDTLPSLPSAYRELTACLQRPDASIIEVARIVDSDLVMTAMVLKLANSAFFGAKQSFRSAERAVSFLGLNTIVGLVLAHSLFNEFDAAKSAGLKLELLWAHSLQVAAGIRALALVEGWPTPRVEEAYLAALLHDIGCLVLATRCNRDSDSAADSTSHAEAGAYLLGLWGFSDSLIEAIAFHHTPSRAAGNELGLPGLLHVADRLAHHFADENPSSSSPEFEPGYLESHGLTARLVDWEAAWPRIPVES
jgi:HD-like signal output (HDOD) protein/CheY-like chemotaxis protein